MRNLAGRVGVAFASSALVLVLAACDGGASAVASREPLTDLTGGSGPPAEARSFAASAPSSSSRAENPTDPRTLPVRQLDGKPVWAATRRLTADDAAAANFERNGADFGIASVNGWIEATHAFVEKPPRGAQTLTRANGDTLIYDAKANVFAVAAKDGAPRTMFKPREGAAYWDEQKQSVARSVARAERPSEDS